MHWALYWGWTFINRYSNQCVQVRHVMKMCHQPPGILVNRNVHSLHLSESTAQTLCSTSLQQTSCPHVCAKLKVCTNSTMLSYSAVNHTQMKEMCGSWDFWVPKTYLKFCSDVLTLCHELWDYLCLLPQVLQLLGEIKFKNRLSIMVTKSTY